MKKVLCAATALIAALVISGCNFGFHPEWNESSVIGFYDDGGIARSIDDFAALEPDKECDYMRMLSARHVVSGKTVRYEEADQLMSLVGLGYSAIQENGPISITRGKLNGSKTVYVICLSGTDSDATSESTNIGTDLLSGFEFDNDYNKAVRKAVFDNIPAGSNLIFTGHSLGGMIAQQCCSDPDIKNAYNVLNTITFGSPLINGFKREGTVKRLGDTSDAVPYLSLTTLTNILWQALGLNREDGGYNGDLVASHTESYYRPTVWGAYDCTGTKGGRTYIDLDFSTIRYFHSVTGK